MTPIGGVIDQRTAVLAALTCAENCCVWPEPATMETVAGVTEMLAGAPPVMTESTVYPPSLAVDPVAAISIRYFAPAVTANWIVVSISGLVSRGTIPQASSVPGAAWA